MHMTAQCSNAMEGASVQGGARCQNWVSGSVVRQLLLHSACRAIPRRVNASAPLELRCLALQGSCVLDAQMTACHRRVNPLHINYPDDYMSNADKAERKTLGPGGVVGASGGLVICAKPCPQLTCSRPGN